MSVSPQTPPPGATAVLVLADGSIYWGRGAGAEGVVIGEVCFNTSITGYQEILTDASYAGQIITFTFPHIGNVGTNFEDIETKAPAARGCVLRADITEPSNWRTVGHLNGWLQAQNLVAVSGMDTRKLTRHIRDGGAPTGVVAHAIDGAFDIPALIEQAKAWPGLEGMDLAKTVTCDQSYAWDGEADWSLEHGYATQEKASVHVVAVSLSFVIPPHKRDRSILVVLNAPAHPWLKLRATLRVVRLHGQQIYTRRGRGELKRAHLSLPLFLLPLHLWHLPLVSVRPPSPPRLRGGGWRLIIFHVVRGCVSHKQI